MNSNTNIFLERTLPNTLAGGLLPALVSLIGLIVCLSSFRRAPRAATWALLGFLLLLLLIFVPLTNDLLIELSRTKHWSSSDLSSALRALSVAWSVVRAIAYGCLIVAVFAQRAAAYPQQPPAGYAPTQQQPWSGYPPQPRA
ncbi:MAG: hypothetical protein JO295_10655 [Verrucomicrobia bacterium]|nr:hypothetical protein [Verrucomicrobiota bacterium]